MKRLLMLMTFTCVLSGSALAGEIPTVGAPAPSPNGTTEATRLGDIPSVGKPGDIPSGGITRQISSDALSIALSAFSFLAV